MLRRLAKDAPTPRWRAELFVEQSTVKTHLIHLYSKLGAHSRTQAVARARALGLWTDPGRGFHPASPPSGDRVPPATPPQADEAAVPTPS